VENNLGVTFAERLVLSLVLGSTLFAQVQSATPQPAQAQAPPATAQPPEPLPPPLPPPGQKLTSNQLDGLVAPIALYPDPLISQVLVAATYPREVTQALQWLRQNPELKGQALTTAAQQQTWDPSIQALVVFPAVLRRMNQDKVWTTNLGNAFLAQQADVMKAIQRMRRAAKDAGKLATNGRMRVAETTDSGETIIEIVPVRPDVLYVPAYNPVWIWGPPLWYPYPRWLWGPPPVAPGVWFGWGGAVSIGAYFGPGWGGWGGWGWHPGWVNNNVVVNNTFIARNNFAPSNPTPISGTGVSNPGPINNASANNTTAPTTPAPANMSANNRSASTTSSNNPGASNTAVWTHDPSHRQGVPYPNNALAQQYHGTSVTQARPGSAARPSLKGAAPAPQARTPRRPAPPKPPARAKPAPK
jgi:hypothetical protein